MSAVLPFCILSFFILFSPVIPWENNFEYRHQAIENGYFENLELASQNPEKVIVLNLYNQGLTSVPPVIFQMHNLEVLDLSHNRITIIPEKIANLKKLKGLYINHNQIKELPNSLVDMPSLKILFIQSNPLNEKKDTQNKIPKKLSRLESGNLPAGTVAPVPQLKKVEN
jgi:Leucine-rich repeat (LRR) protein